jgi:hypothetical protein
MWTMRLSRTQSSIMLRIACALLLVVLGFSHRPMSASAAEAAELALYTLPDGTIASLCLVDQDGKPIKHVDRGCEACRLASGIALPDAPTAHADIVRRETAVAYVFAAERFHRLNFPPNAPPRGPPAILFSFEAA